MDDRVVNEEVCTRQALGRQRELVKGIPDRDWVNNSAPNDISVTAAHTQASETFRSPKPSVFVRV